jgi:hypothetical protein
MGRFNTLYLGEPTDAAQELEDTDADNGELRAALINALNRIAKLEERIAAINAVRACGCNHLCKKSTLPPDVRCRVSAE